MREDGEDQEDEEDAEEHLSNAFLGSNLTPLCLLRPLRLPFLPV